jgi:hypothetical protein
MQQVEDETSVLGRSLGWHTRVGTSVSRVGDREDWSGSILRIVWRTAPLADTRLR